MSNGRPRDQRIDVAVLAATVDLLGEVGYADLTVAAIADRAGTSRPAVYRRWPSKAHVVHEAVFADGAVHDAPDTGAFRSDLRAVVSATARALSTPLARLAVPGLVAEAVQDPALHRKVLARFVDQGWSGLDAWVRRARATGDLAESVDVSALMEIVIGAALARLLVSGPDGLDDAWAERTTRVLLDGVGTRRSAD